MFRLDDTALTDENVTRVAEKQVGRLFSLFSILLKRRGFKMSLKPEEERTSTRRSVRVLKFNSDFNRVLKFQYQKLSFTPENLSPRKLNHCLTL